MKITVTSDKARYDEFKSKFEVASKELTVLLENESYLNKPINFLLNVICKKYGFDLRSYVTYDYLTNKYSLITKLFDKETSCNLEISTTTDINLREAAVENAILLFDEKLPKKYVG
ncbi:hypothetical protein [Lactobacillus johnsonii]|uniref:hypothetical protein n=1 Tax=Lactobacillus johnsonii TaxID=33959 RepID=UPI001434829F|nr:hypothetical protein [Lactobacillus johnsonii]GFI21206.1 hypothetical protein IMSAGC010_01773 [Lactobacillus johnsonii]